MSDLEQKKLFSIQPVPGKGNGVIATSAIAKGTRIHAESPIITLPTFDEARNAPALNELVLKQLRSLTRDQQRHFFSLRNIHGMSLPIPLGIVETNALAFGPGGEGGVFLTASQFNHDCLPSARSNWNVKLGMMAIHALCDIEAGQEITITYINLETRAERQRILQDGFHFTCVCKICTLPQEMIDELDTIILEIKEIDKFLKENNMPLEIGLRLAYRQRYLIESSCLDMAHAPDTYKFAAKMAAVYKDYARAKVFSERQLAIDMDEYGPDHPEALTQQDMDGYLGSLLEKHYGPLIPYHFRLNDLENWLWMQHLPEEHEGETGEVASEGTADEISHDYSSHNEMGFDVETVG